MIKIFLRFPASERSFVMSAVQTKQSTLKQIQAMDKSDRVDFHFTESGDGIMIYIKFGLTERIFKKKIIERFKKDFEGHDVIIETP